MWNNKLNENISQSINYVFSNYANAISIEPIIFRHINEIANIVDNWDAHGAIKPNISTLSHIKSFLNNLEDKYLVKISEDDIFPNPHGTITIRLQNKKNYLNIEFGESYANYYSFINKEIKHKGTKAVLTRYIPYAIKQGIQDIELYK